MKKFLVFASLALVIVLTAVACTGTETPADTTVDTSAATEAGTAAGTDAATDAATEAGTTVEGTEATTEAGTAVEGTEAGTAVEGTEAGTTVEGTEAATEAGTAVEGTEAGTDEATTDEAVTEEAVTEAVTYAVDFSTVTVTSDPAFAGIFDVVQTNANDTVKAVTLADGSKVADGQLVPLLFEGSISLGEMDLSKYSKVVISYACNTNPTVPDSYAAIENPRVYLMNASSDDATSPAAATVVASAGYEMSTAFWTETSATIDLSEVNYNGATYFTMDFSPLGAAGGLFFAITSIVFYE